MTTSFPVLPCGPPGHTGETITNDEILACLDKGPMLTDGGLETALIFERGIDLPLFAAFPLLETEDGEAELRAYYGRYLDLAAERELGFILESPSWRASPRWADELGVSPVRLDGYNRRAIELLAEIREDRRTDVDPILVSGCIGPREDGYRPERHISAEESEKYHGRQIRVFAEAGADLVTAMTLGHTGEAVGIVRAARASELPSVISFTVETDGRLPSGIPLDNAIPETDDLTGGGPAYYMINCAHPTHFGDTVLAPGTWQERVRALRCNASRMSHEQLDGSEDLDAGDPVDFAARNAGLRRGLPEVSVLGGCCGTDERHISELRDAWLTAD